MSITGFIIGLVAVFGYIVPAAVFNYVGWLDWINISFAAIGLIVSLTGVVRAAKRYYGVIGIILNAVIIVLCSLRLF
jgi:hypothetical protein